MEWISIQKDLPELHESVLVCNVNGLWQDERDPFIGALDINGWFQPWIDDNGRCVVTHWMPLPDAPEII